MTDRTFSAEELPGASIRILEGRTVLQVVSITDDHAWAAARTWDLARAAAAGKRRVALIDLSLETPVLDRHATKTGDEGIVDAFLYGVSLSHVAQAQDVNGLYYVGVGTRTAEPADVWGSDRWDRLARGFENEGAVLITFVPVGALNRCSMRSDGILVLAPDGYDPFTDVAPGITRKLRDGTPMVGVVIAAQSYQAPAQRPSAPAPAPPPTSDEATLTDAKPVAGPPRTSRPEQTAAPHGQAWNTSSSPTADLPLIETTELELGNTGNVTPTEGLVSTPSRESGRAGFERLVTDRGSADDAADITPRDLEPAPLTPAEGSAGPTSDPASIQPSHPERESTRFKGQERDDYAPPRRASRPAPRYSGRPIFEPMPRSSTGNRLFWIGGAIAVVAVTGGLYYWYDRSPQEVEAPAVATTVDSGATESTTVDSGATESTTVDSGATDSLVAAPVAVPESVVATPIPLDEGDTLYYSVQVAALNTIDRALEHGNQFRERRIPTTVAPVRVQGRVWFRVILGAYRTSSAADSALRSLWNDGLVENLQGTILRTPQAFDLGRRDSFDDAQSEAQSLWERGIPATVLPAPGGGATLSVGAFERPSQAEEAENLLTTSNVNATLGPRMGIIR